LEVGLMRTLVSHARSRTVAVLLIAAMVGGTAIGAVSIFGAPVNNPVAASDASVIGAASRFVAQTFDGDVTSIARVDTTRDLTGQVLGFSVPAGDTSDVVVVQLTGRFKALPNAVAAGSPSGTQVLLVMDPTNNTVLDWGVANAPADLNKLGPARVLLTV